MDTNAQAVNDAENVQDVDEEVNDVEVDDAEEDAGVEEAADAETGPGQAEQGQCLPGGEHRQHQARGEPRASTCCHAA